jgi:hypothetical protein
VAEGRRHVEEAEDRVEPRVGDEEPREEKVRHDLEEGEGGGGDSTVAISMTGTKGLCRLLPDGCTEGGSHAHGTHRWHHELLCRCEI